MRVSYKYLRQLKECLSTEGYMKCIDRGMRAEMIP